MGVLQDRVGIVTGGSRGIGEGIVRAALAEGASVVATGRGADDLRALADRMAAGDRLLCVRGDTADPAHRRETVRLALERFGALHFLVNNVSVPSAGRDPLADNDDDFRRMLDVNVVAPRAWIREAWTAWLGEHGGAVVNIASVAGVAHERGIGLYAVSKAALVHLTGQLALELAPRLRVNAVAPGLVLTSGTERVREHLAAFEAGYPLGRVGVPADIAPAVIHLLSDAASWTTGQTLVVDGGFTLTTAQVQPD